MSVNFDLDAFDKEIENAPRSGFGPRVAFGKLTISDIQIMAWKRKARGEKGEPDPRPFKAGDHADTAKGEYLQITFNLDIQELSERAKEEGWEWNRRVDVKLSSEDGKTKTDWDAIVLPSLVKVLGADWKAKVKKGVYVEIDEPETVARDRQGQPKGWTGQDGVWRVNTTFRVLRVFKNRSECDAARAERFAAREDSSEEAGDGLAATTKKIPAKVISDVKGVLSAYDDDTENEELRELLTTNAPYNLYPIDQLLEAATK